MTYNAFSNERSKSTLTIPGGNLDGVVRHAAEVWVRLVPAGRRVPGVVTPLPGHLPVKVDERDEHVVDGVHDDHVVVDAHQAADHHHAPADTLQMARGQLMCVLMRVENITQVAWLTQQSLPKP